MKFEAITKPVEVWWSCVAMLEFVVSMVVEVSVGRIDIGANGHKFYNKIKKMIGFH